MDLLVNCAEGIEQKQVKTTFLAHGQLSAQGIQILIYCEG